jgi:hypothetical protein
MSPLRFFLAAVCAWAGAGCDELAPVVSHDDSPVQTDSLAYTLRRDSVGWWAYVAATYRNVDTGAVYFVRCTSKDSLPTFSVRRTGADSTRMLLAGRVWNCPGGAATGSLPPGAAITVRVWVGSADQPRMQPPFQRGWLVGLMRVELDLCRSFATASADCDPLPQAERQSNAFEVGF